LTTIGITFRSLHEIAFLHRLMFRAIALTLRVLSRLSKCAQPFPGKSAIFKGHG
jgi:hypothetical protein